MLNKCKCGCEAEFVDFEDYEDLEAYIAVRCTNDNCEEMTDFYNVYEKGKEKAEKEWNDNH